MSDPSILDRTSFDDHLTILSTASKLSPLLQHNIDKERLRASVSERRTYRANGLFQDMSRPTVCVLNDSLDVGGGLRLPTAVLWEASQFQNLKDQYLILSHKKVVEV